YWLREPHSSGIFTVSETSLIGQPDNPPAVTFASTFVVAGEPAIVELPLVYRWTDPVKGEQYRPVEVVPALSLTVSNGVWIFGDESPKELSVRARSQSAMPVKGKVKLNLPEGWKYSPQEMPFELAGEGDGITTVFEISPPSGVSEGL